MATFGLTDEGLLIKRFSDIVSELELAFKSEYGDESNLDPETSLNGKLINIFSEREAAIWELVKEVHDSAYPDSADGVNLDGVSDLTGTDRLPATFSSVTVTITGTPGSLGIAGRIFEVTGTGERFETVADATIEAGGTVDVLCSAQETGAVQANATTLSIIVTPVSGWDSITNALDADVGRPVESDAALRLRRLQDLEIVGAATVDAIRARILEDVTGVTDAFVIENDTGATVDEVPSKAINCIVAGGADQDIADKIFGVKAAGIEPFGTDVTKTVVDSQGINHTVKFDRADEIDIWFFAEINATSDFELGAKQDDKVTITAYDAVTIYSLSIAGVTVTSLNAGTAPLTALKLATDINDTAGEGWVPVTATDNADGTFNLVSDYEGNPFTATIGVSLGTGTISQTSEVENSGDAAQIISDIIDFANGTDILPKEQVIGKDVNRSRYFTPINQTLYITDITITLADTTLPVTVPPGGGDWSAADVVIGATDVADIDSTRVSIKVTIV